MSSITETFNAQLEQVAPALARYWSYDDQLVNSIPMSKVATATRYLYRIPIERSPGGVMMKYIADNGDMGSGSGPKYSHLTAGYIDSLLNFELTNEQIHLSESSEQARADVFTDTLDRAFEVMNAHDNLYLHGDGSGRLTNAAASGTSTTLTFDAATDHLGTNQVLQGMAVDAWNDTGATKRAGGPYYIEAFDELTKTVTFNTAPTALGTTDLLAVYNVDAYGPSTLASFSSTWPGGGAASINANGLTGDSWMHGFRYVNDATSSNYYLGRLKSTMPELMPKYVNGGGVELTWPMGELLKNRIIQRRGQSALDGLKFIVHMAQLSVIKEAIQATYIVNADSGGKMVDLNPNTDYGETVMFAGISTMQSRCQDMSRVDGFNPKSWGRVEGFPARFHEINGNRLFHKRSSSTANLKAGLEFKVERKFDWVCDDPGSSGYIYNLKRPTGY